MTLYCEKLHLIMMNDGKIHHKVVANNNSISTRIRSGVRELQHPSTNIASKWVGLNF